MDARSVTTSFEESPVVNENASASQKPKDFFVELGFQCPPRQTTADFLTSLTNPTERVVRKGFEGKTPSTPDAFATVWQNSEDRARLLRDIEEFDRQYPIGGPSLDEFKKSRKASQAKSQRTKSPYTLSVPMQIKLLTTKAMAPASIFSLTLIIYTGFAIPVKNMRPWFRWLNYLNPVGYAFEALMINEVRTSRMS
ncbi:MAG: hypothetical protein Q9221_008556 [Calogaya cf. arnoldii]